MVQMTWVMVRSQEILAHLMSGYEKELQTNYHYIYSILWQYGDVDAGSLTLTEYSTQ